MAWKWLSKRAVLSLAVVLPVGSAGTNARAASLTEAVTQREGHELCQAILRAYTARVAHSSQVPLGPEIDITQTVLPYVKPGMSFDQAIQILRAAGLKVSGKPGPQGWPGNRPDKFTVSAYSYEFFNRTLAYRIIRPVFRDYTRKLFITLYPERPGDYGRVSEVTASIGLTSL